MGLLTDAQAQNLSGKWVGYYTASNGVTYPYEINIQNNGKQDYTATTLTKFSSKLSAKATATVIVTNKVQLVNIIETRFDQLILSANSHACLMSNHLSYFTENGREILQGTYMSNNLTGAGDCGTGTVILVKELVLVSVKTENKQKIVKENKIDNKKISISKEVKIADTSKEIAVNKAPIPINPPVVQILNDTPKQVIQTAPIIIKKSFQQIPWVLISRDNKLLKKINVNKNIVGIDLIDNGSFDNDSISVYDNNVLLLGAVKLSFKPIHFDLHFNEKIKEHAIILVANKTGTTTPANSSLMIVKDGIINDEFYINPNIKSNNKIIIKFEPKE